MGEKMISMNKRLLIIIPLLILIFAAVTCKRKPAVRPVAIIGMDGIEWRIVRKMISEGELPNFKKIIENGTSSEMSTLKPMLSPAIWTTIATGVLPETHGITWFMVKDANGQMIPVTSAQRRVKALWNIAGENKRDVDVVGWWATWPAEVIRGRMLSDHMGFHIFAIQSEKIDTDVGNTYPENLCEKISSKNIDPFDIPLSEIKRYMKITDLEYNVSVDMDALCARPEYKQCLYCRGVSDIPFCHFNPLHHFLRALATLESFSGMSQYLLREKQPDLFMVYFEWVDVVCHQYMKFTSPRMEWVTDEQYAKYNEVIKQTYVRQDEVLGEFLAALSPDTNILIMSDHGFKIEDERLREMRVTTVAKAHLWHHEPAFLAMYGPDIRKGGKQIRARVQDITPTVLALMALPVAEDMDGGVLKGAIEPSFLQKFPIKHIKTYESEGKKVERVASAEDVSGSNIDPQIKERLMALGYIGDVDNSGLEVNRARLLMDKGKFDEAIEVVESVLAIDPDNIRAIIMLGDLYLQMKRFDKAAKAYSRIEDVSPSKLGPKSGPIVANIIANWGIALMNIGDFQTAEEKCRQAVVRNSSNYLGHFCLGRIAEVQQRNDEAINHYKESVRLNPMSGEAHNNLGNCYLRKEMFEKAIEQYKKAAEVNPAHVECHHNAGIAYLKLGKPEEAEKEFRAALRLNSSLAPSLVELGSVLMELKKYQEAADTFRKLASLHPMNPAPLVRAAGAEISAGNRDTAIQLLKKARALNPVATDQRVISDPLFKDINPEQLR